jgi:hypothetical protein
MNLSQIIGEINKDTDDVRFYHFIRMIQQSVPCFLCDELLEEGHLAAGCRGIRLWSTLGLTAIKTCYRFIRRIT